MNETEILRPDPIIPKAEQILMCDKKGCSNEANYDVLEIEHSNTTTARPKSNLYCEPCYIKERVKRYEHDCIQRHIGNTTTDALDKFTHFSRILGEL